MIDIQLIRRALDIIHGVGNITCVTTTQKHEGTREIREIYSAKNTVLFVELHGVQPNGFARGGMVANHFFSSTNDIIRSCLSNWGCHDSLEIISDGHPIKISFFLKERGVVLVSALTRNLYNCFVSNHPEIIAGFHGYSEGTEGILADLLDEYLVGFREWVIESIRVIS